MSECCLLQICCNFAQREKRAVEHYMAMGHSSGTALKLATDLLAMVDALVALSPEAVTKLALSHKG